MNFLLRSTQSSVPAVEPAPPPVAEPVEKAGWLESSASWPGALAGAAGAPQGGGPGAAAYGAPDEDARLIPGSARMRTRMPIEDHADVPPGDGSILVPFREWLHPLFAARPSL
jgi:hypothetical protein